MRTYIDKQGCLLRDGEEDAHVLFVGSPSERREYLDWFEKANGRRLEVAEANVPVVRLMPAEPA